MLTLRRGTVTVAEPADGATQRLEVDLEGERRPAIADVALLGAAEVGDDVVVNVAARDLRLGSGGFDVLHVNLTRGLGGEGTPDAHVMKLGYTSLQHAVLPVEGPELAVPLEKPAAVFFLHGHLAPLAFAFAAASRGARLGYVQTAGGALPGGLSQAVALLRERGLLAG
ncbi:MAG: hypothetical protein JWN32_4420, partial [Solirubrobacterales bacterium]|nr:hypothetical protein [Solirubrobacterales bacterium]